MSQSRLQTALCTADIRKSFINTVSGDHQCEEPQQFLGGIIADPMGLGKTLTMIALIATDLQGYRTGEFAFEQSAYDVETNKTTLVVVPPPCVYSVALILAASLTFAAVLDTWEEQLSQ